MIYLCCIIPITIFLKSTYSSLYVGHVPRDKGTTLWCETHVWSYFSSVSRSSGMTFGWYSERELWNGHPSYVSYPVYRAFKFETQLICIVFSDPTPVFSNFHIVPGPSLEYNTAIFTECYPRIENWNYLTKSSRQCMWFIGRSIIKPDMQIWWYNFSFAVVHFVIMSLLFLQCAETQCPRRVTLLPVITFAPSHCKFQHSVRCFVDSGLLPLNTSSSAHLLLSQA